MSQMISVANKIHVYLLREDGTLVQATARELTSNNPNALFKIIGF